MALTDLKHLDYFKHSDFITVICSNNIIKITGIDESTCDEEFEIYLDKSTAIKFAKTLRTEINKIES